MSNLVLKAVANNDEYQLANDLMAKVHTGNYYKNLSLLQALGNGYPGYSREHTRIAYYNGVLAGALRVTTDTIRLGEARLKTGGFGWVATHPDFRHKGVARELMVDTQHYLKQHAYHVSMLFGIPNFYHRFGFATTLADYSTHIQVAELIGGDNPALTPDVFKGYKVRPCKPGDIPVIQKIHNANDIDSACSLIRMRMHYTRRWVRWEGTQVLSNKAGKVLGFYHPEEFQGKWRIRDIGTIDQSASAAMLWHLAQWAHDHCLSVLKVVAPPSHPFIQFIAKFESVHETINRRDSEGMMAIVNLGETLESMIPEWENQMLSSALLRERISLTLVVERSSYRIRNNLGVLDICPGVAENKFSVSSQELLQLLTGYRHFEDVVGEKRRMLSPKARQFLAVLFPKRTPFVWPFDRF